MIKQIFLLLFSSVLLMGCNQNMVDTGFTPTPGARPDLDALNSELGDIVNQFKTRYPSAFVNFSITVDTVKTGGTSGSGTIIGLCEVYNNGNRYIYINQSWFSNTTTSAVSKKILVFHELGHCSLGRSHLDTKYASGMPYSIMNSIINPITTYFPANESYYLSELENPSVGGSLGPMVDESFFSNSVIQQFFFTEEGCDHSAH